VLSGVLHSGIQVSKMVDIQVDQKSIDTVLKSFDEYGVDAAKALGNAIYRTALNIESDAKRRLRGQLGSAKHWVTGRLASSIHTETKGYVNYKIGGESAIVSGTSFTGNDHSQPEDSNFGMQVDDLEALVGTNVVYGPRIETDFDPFITFATNRRSPELPKKIEDELNKLAKKFNK
jgi:hypothetical protein